MIAHVKYNLNCFKLTGRAGSMRLASNSESYFDRYYTDLTLPLLILSDNQSYRYVKYIASERRHKRLFAVMHPRTAVALPECCRCAAAAFLDLMFCPNAIRNTDKYCQLSIYP